MINRHNVFAVLTCSALALLAASPTAQTGAETFTATAAIKAAGGAAATAPVTIVVNRKMTQQEADALTGAFTKGGLAALRKALTGVAPTGSIQIGKGNPTPTRLTLERVTEQGRMLTVVTDQPLVLLGAGLPGAKPKEGYDFGLVDVVVNAQGSGKGTMSPAAKITVKQGVFVVEEYSGELVQLTDVKKVK
jgi:hypothetical protein